MDPKSFLLLVNLCDLAIFYCLLPAVPVGCMSCPPVLYSLLLWQKKNNQVQFQALSYEAEQEIIHHDLLRVLVLNIVYLAIILGLYFTNLRQLYLLNFFHQGFPLLGS